MNDRYPSVSVVIPSLDGGDLLLACLGALEPERQDIEVIVVDNGSTDGSVTEAARRYPSLRIARNDTNRGYATACNQGSEIARAELVLFVNNDATITPVMVDVLLAAARLDTDTAIWQPVTRGVDGTLESAGDVFTAWGIMQHLPDVPDQQSAEVFSTVGAALLVRREIFAMLGGFEDSYFAYYEETDLCWRARLAGWHVRVVTGAEVVHHGSLTTARVFPPHAVRYLGFRNRIRTICANASAPTLARIVPLHLLACLAFVVLYVVTGRPRSALAVLQAVWWTLGHLDVIGEQRRRAQAMRRRSDREVLGAELRGSFRPRTIWRHLRRAYWFERAADRASAAGSDETGTG